MTNREAWRKGYEHGFKGLYPVADFSKVGLAGSYHEGYKAGAKRRKEPKGPKQNPGFIVTALAKHKVKQARKRVTAEIERVRRRISELEEEIIEYRHGPIWKGDQRAKQWAARASLQKQKLQAIEKKLVKAEQELPVINPGIVEAAAGLQALDYLGSRVRKTGLGKKPKFNPKGEHRFLLQIVPLSGKPEQHATNSEKQAKEIAASWYSRGASVTVIDRKKKTQTAYGKKNPGNGFGTLIAEITPYTHKTAKPGEYKVTVWRIRGGKQFFSAASVHPSEAAAKAYVKKKGLKIKNPRVKGSRDALGVFHAENPTEDGLRYRAIPKDPNKRVIVVDTFSGKVFSGPLTVKEARHLIKTLRAQYTGHRVMPLRKNPSVTDLSRTFQGDADGSIEKMYAASSAPANLARAGKLVFLKAGGRMFRIPGTVVAIAPNERLWITGDHAPLFETKAKNGEGLVIGEATEICYETAKAHIGNGKTFEYHHIFGEDGGKLPLLVIDHEGMPILRGGDYKIRAEGIVN